MMRARTLFACCAVFLHGVAAAQGVTLPELERIEFDNGAVIILLEKKEVPLVGIEVAIRGGAVADPEGRAGLASLVAGLLQKGAGERSAAEFAEAVAAVGGALTAAADLEAITVSGEFLARDAELMVDLLVDMLREPTLDAAEVRKLRDRQVDLIRSYKDTNLRALTPIYGNAFLFMEHPYGTPVTGSEESLAAISPADVRDYYASHFGGDRLVIAVAGDFDRATMLEKLTAGFSDWPAASAALPDVAAPERESGRRVLLVDKPGATQTYFWIGNVGVGLDFESRAELDIANTLFGGRFTSILMNELRTKSGLTYSATSSLKRYMAGGSVAIVSYTATKTTVEAMDLALSLLEKLRAAGVADDMIASGKNYILGQFAPQLETAEQLASQVAMLEALELDASYINDYGAAIAAADGEAIRAVITEVYPPAEDLVFAVIGDAELIREELAKYGPVTEMPITDPRFRPH